MQHARSDTDCRLAWQGAGKACRDVALGLGQWAWKKLHKLPEDQGGCPPVLTATMQPHGSGWKTCVCCDHDKQQAATRFQRLVSVGWHQHFNPTTCSDVAETEAQKKSWPAVEARMFNHFSNSDHSACNTPSGVPAPCQKEVQAPRKGHSCTCGPQLKALRDMTKTRCADQLDRLVIDSRGAVTTSVVESHNGASLKKCFG